VIKCTEPLVHDYLVTADTSDMCLQRRDKVNDLGVTIDANLSFKYQINDKVNKAYSWSDKKKVYT